MAHIVTLIHKEGGSYGASFPDFPGATTVAGDLDTLYRKAAEVLAFHVAGMIEDGEDLPRIRSWEDLESDPAFRADSEGARVAIVPVDLPGKSVRVQATFEEGLLRRIDRAAEARGETRSGFLAQAARTRLAAEG